MKRIIVLIVIIFALASALPAQDKGIKWITGMSLDQIKERAKKENKYIFLDIYTTWCGPCKQMDQTVYVNEAVGNFMNERFLSVRVQMDKTDKDNAAVKSWYGEVADISKRYTIEGYPTFLFLGPDGEAVHKGIGALHIDEFLKMANLALNSHRKYVDPLSIYKDEITDFDKGIINQETLPSTIMTARRLNDTAHFFKMLVAHVDYVSGLSPEKRYTKDNIQFWQGLSPGRNTRIFGFFYNDGAIIDKVMNCKDYAERSVVDRAIADADVKPFLNQQAKLIREKTGNVLEIDRSEADWTALENLLNAIYNQATVKRVMLNAKIDWYNANHNYEAFTSHIVLKLKQFPFDIHDGNSLLAVNSLVWKVFMYSTNKKELNEAVKWSKYLVDYFPEMSMVLDTHANLLYKTGRKEEGISYEKKALEFRPGSSEFINNIEHMQKGEPTNLEHHARW